MIGNVGIVTIKSFLKVLIMLVILKRLSKNKNKSKLKNK